MYEVRYHHDPVYTLGSVLVIFCGVRNHSKMWWLETKAATFSPLTFSVGQGFQKGFVVLFRLGVPQVVAFKWHLKLKGQEAGAAGSWLGSLSPYSLRILHDVCLHGKLWASSQHGGFRAAGLLTWAPV